jgi:hypothetical protein
MARLDREVPVKYYADVLTLSYLSARLDPEFRVLDLVTWDLFLFHIEFFWNGGRLNKGQGLCAGHFSPGHLKLAASVILPTNIRR